MHIYCLRATLIDASDLKYITSVYLSISLLLISRHDMSTEITLTFLFCLISAKLIDANNILLFDLFRMHIFLERVAAKIIEVFEVGFLPPLLGECEVYVLLITAIYTNTQRQIQNLHINAHNHTF